MTLGETISAFDAWLGQEVTHNHIRPLTQAYYRQQLQPLAQDADLAGMEAGQVEVFKLNGHVATWHKAQAVQRLFAWAEDQGMIATPPKSIRRLKKPPAGRREQIYSPHQLARIIRAAKRPFRDILIALRETGARPGEIRAITRTHLTRDLFGTIAALADFKCKRSRKDQLAQRTLVWTPRLERLTTRLLRNRPADWSGHIFLNTKGKPWTKNALCLAFRRLRNKTGINPQCVLYTFRHTVATTLAARGVNQAVLAAYMGHTNVTMTARYYHPDVSHLREASRHLSHKGDHR